MAPHPNLVNEIKTKKDRSLKFEIKITCREYAATLVYTHWLLPLRLSSTSVYIKTAL